MHKLRLLNAGESESEIPQILMYGDVGYDWDGFRAADVAHILQGLGNAKEICCRINSMGGDVGEGLAIYNLLQSHGATITTKNDGYALSSAATIFCAGQNRVMGAGSVLMLHKPTCFSYGDADALRKEANILDVLQTQIAGIYSRTCGKSVDDCNKLMDAETWLTGEEAKEMNLATAMVAGDGPAGPDGDDEEGDEEYGDFVPARFRNCPAKFLQRFKNAKRQAGVGDPWRREMDKRWLQLHAHA